MKKIDEHFMKEYLERMALRGLSGEKWEKYFREKVAWLVKLSDGTLFEIEKPSIETHFCFGERGYDYDDAVHAACEARTNEDLFRIRNLRAINDKIAELENGPDPGCKMWVNVVYGVSADYVNHGDEWHMELVNCKTHELTKEDRDAIRAGYEIVKEAFEKRINTYLKRYGLSKVRSWTYWVDA